MSDWLCKDCGAEFMGQDCRCVQRMRKESPVLKEEAMTEPKRDEAMELAEKIITEKNKLNIDVPAETEQELIASLIRPHLAPRPVGMEEQVLIHHSVRKKRTLVVWISEDSEEQIAADLESVVRELRGCIRRGSSFKYMSAGSGYTVAEFLAEQLK